MLRKYLMSLVLSALALFATASARADENLIILTGHKDCCAPAPCCKEKCTTEGKACEPSVEKKTKDIRKYNSACEVFCMPRCKLSLSSFGRKCDSCDSCNKCDSCEQCQNCEKPRTRKVLIVKVKKEEYCVNTCKVVDAPCCPKACGSCCGTVIVESKSAEKLPNKPNPEKK